MSNGTAVEPASPGPPPPVAPPATVQQQAAPALMRVAPTSPLRSAPGLPPLAIPRYVVWLAAVTDLSLSVFHVSVIRKKCKPVARRG
jgi:hypothetical protein